jgi:hypothetical protein
MLIKSREYSQERGYTVQASRNGKKITLRVWYDSQSGRKVEHKLVFDQGEWPPVDHDALYPDLTRVLFLIDRMGVSLWSEGYCTKNRLAKLGARAIEEIRTAKAKLQKAKKKVKA